jgi:aquaporin Z
MIPSSQIEAATSRIANVELILDIRRSPAKQFLNSLVRAITARWPEYSIEAALLCLFMLSACTVTTLLELPSSPLRQAIPYALFRRALTGAAMGLTAVALIYSPWGQRSGAHFNPSVTLTFYRVGKISAADAALYILAQFLGGLIGVMTAIHLLGSRVAQPEVHYAATYPGRYGIFPAALSELIISFLLMLMVLCVSSRVRLSKFTGVFAGLLVATYITFEAPFSGMSMNPARTFASALPSGIWTGFWIYVVVPPLGMLAAAEFFIRHHGRGSIRCCKIYHNPTQHCTFCGANGGFHD